jgi:cephalosporin hydroxylase
MENKKIYTRDEFAQLLRESADSMAADEKLQRDALDVLVRADHYRWIHQTTWMGEPVLNLPQDMFALQEIIFKTRPKYVVEIGVAWGGSLLFYATLLEMLGGEKAIGVDLFIPDDLRQRLMSHGRLSERICLINGSSIEHDTFQQVSSLLGNSRDVMIFLDSFHTHDHVLQELRLYSPLVGKGQYLVCGDTIVQDIPAQEHRQRPWGPGNNPKTAVEAFLKENDRFEVDLEIENKLLLTCNPGGFLKCIRD